MNSKRKSWHLERYAYHEAGHAIVGHVAGRCIAEVSIIPNKQQRYRGFCSFNKFAELEHQPRLWSPDGTYSDVLYKACMLRIMSAGSVAFCLLADERGWNFEYWNKGASEDATIIHHLLESLTDDEAEHKRLYEEAIEHDYDVLIPCWGVVEDLAESLIEHGHIEGSEAHHLINESLGWTIDDWRIVPENHLL